MSYLNANLHNLCLDNFLFHLYRNIFKEAKRTQNVNSGNFFWACVSVFLTPTQHSVQEICSRRAYGEATAPGKIRKEGSFCLWWVLCASANHADIYKPPFANHIGTWYYLYIYIFYIWMFRENENTYYYSRIQMYIVNMALTFENTPYARHINGA